MTVETVVVRLPQDLLTHFQERAQQTQRTVEEELVAVLTAALAVDDEALSTDVTDALASLVTLSDDALWQTARDSHLSPAAAAHLEELNQKRQRAGLSGDEQRMAETLIQQYERLLLVRAEALARLKERGCDIAPLLKPHTV